MVSGGLFLRLAIIFRGKRRRVFEAIDQNQPAFAKAQSYWWLVAVLWLALFGSILAWEARWEGAVGRGTLLLTIAFAVVAGVFIFPVSKLLPRFRKR